MSNLTQRDDADLQTMLEQIIDVHRKYGSAAAARLVEWRDTLSRILDARSATPNIDAVPLRREVEVAIERLSGMIVQADTAGSMPAVIAALTPIRAALGRILDKLDRDLNDANDVASVRREIDEARAHGIAHGEVQALIPLTRLLVWISLLRPAIMPATTGEAAQQHDVKRGPYGSRLGGGSWAIECICGFTFLHPGALGLERCIAAFAEQHAGHPVIFEVERGPISMALPPEYGGDGIAPRCEAHGIGLCSWCMNGQARGEDEPPRRGRLGEICDLLDDIGDNKTLPGESAQVARMVARLVSEALSDQLVEPRK